MDEAGRGPLAGPVVAAAVILDSARPIRGLADSSGRKLMVSEIAVADEIAGAAELVMGKLDRIPVALVRGYAYQPGGSGMRRLLRDRAQDLFR